MESFSEGRPPGGPAPGAGTGSAAGTAATSSSAPSGARRPSLWAQAQDLIRELPGLVSDRVELLTLELRRAGTALVKIVVLVLAAAILGITAWLVLWAALVGGLIAAGLHWSAALLVALLINLGAIAAALLWAKRLLPDLQLPATRRHLTPTPSPHPKALPAVPPHGALKPIHPAAATPATTATFATPDDRQPRPAAGRPVAP